MFKYYRKIMLYYFMVLLFASAFSLWVFAVTWIFCAIFEPTPEWVHTTNNLLRGLFQ